MEKLARGLVAITLILPWLWLSGLHVADLARVLFVVSVLVLGLASVRRRKLFRDNPLVSSTAAKSFFAYALIFPLLSSLFIFSRFQLGSVGLDFSLFAQVVDTIARYGSAQTSLLSLEWQNFLGHHLDLSLWLPAALSAIGLSAVSSLIWVHGISLALILLFLTALARLHPSRFFLISLLVILPVFRHSFLWSVHDDFFALPFMAASWVFWRQKQHVPMLISLILLLLCKETMGLWVFGFSLATWVWDRRPSGLIMATSGLIFFCAYVFLQPWLLGKEFDHISKISSVAQLFTLEILWDKASFLVQLLLPFVILLWGTRPQLKDFALLLPAMPFLAIIGISNFDEMWRPLNYYGVIPAFTFLLMSVDLLARTRRTLQPAQFLLVMTLAFSVGTLKPGVTYYKAWTAEKVQAPEMSSFPPTARFALSPFAHASLIHDQRAPLPGGRFPGRALWFEKKGETPDFVVLRSGEEDSFPPGFLARLRPCEGTPETGQEKGQRHWMYLCP